VVNSTTSIERVSALAGHYQPVASSQPGVTLTEIRNLTLWQLALWPDTVDAKDGARLDLSQSRTHIRVTGTHATTVLNSYLPLDLREQSFPVDSVASTAFHHVGVTLYRSAEGYDLFVPRGFAVSLWELLCEASEQYQLEVI